VAERQFAAAVVETREFDRDAGGRVFAIGCEVEDDAARAVEFDESTEVVGVEFATAFDNAEFTTDAAVDLDALHLAGRCCEPPAACGFFVEPGVEHALRRRREAMRDADVNGVLGHFGFLFFRAAAASSSLSIASSASIRVVHRRS
jgi:hypothetical protein